MTGIKRFEDILAWQKARELNKMIYLLTSEGNLSKDTSLCRQMRRSSIYVLSNIAEGFERRGDKEFIRFLRIAKGSGAELKSQTYAALDIKLMDKNDFDKVSLQIDETNKLLQGFINYLLKKSENPKHIIDHGRTT